MLAVQGDRVDDVVAFEALVWWDTDRYHLEVEGVVHLTGPDRVALRRDARAAIAFELDVDVDQVDVRVRGLH